MKLVMTHLGEASPFELMDGSHSVGGAPEDAVCITPLPPSLLTLVVEGEVLHVEARGPVDVDGVTLLPGRRRLLLHGETLALPSGVTLARARDEAQAPSGTESVFLRLLEAPEATPPQGVPTFTCLSGRDAGRVWALAGACIVLGRAPDVEVQVRDRAVSRHHARLLLEDGQHVLEDLGGPNGVYVRGERVRRRVALRDGDVLELGQSLLRFGAAGAPREPASGSEPGAAVLPAAAPWSPRLKWVLGAALVLACAVATLVVFGP